MKKNVFYIYIIAAIILISGAGISAQQIAHFLVPGASGIRYSLIMDGIYLLKILFFIDLALLVAFGLCRRKNTSYLDKLPYAPLWKPPENRKIYWDNIKNYKISVLGILLTAFILRIISLNSDLWIDEVITVVNFIRLPAGEILTDFSNDNQHLFFSLLSHFSVSIFGESAWAIRLPSVLFGLASIIAAIQLATLVYGRRVAVYSGLLLSISYHHIWFSQNARGYAILLFGTIYSTFLLLNALRTGKWRYWIGYALIIALSAWAHITAVFVSIAHALVVFILLMKSGDFKEKYMLPLLGFLLTAWVTIHFYAIIIPQMIDFFSQPGGGTGIVQTEWRSPLWLFNEAFRSLGVGQTFGWLGISTILLVAITSCYWFVKYDWVFVSMAILPGLLLGFTMLMLGRNLWPRMFLNEIGFIFILITVAALSAGNISKKLIFHKLSWFPRDLFVWVITITFLASLKGLYRYPKQDFTGARDFVKLRITTGDSVVGLHIAGRIYNIYYEKKWPEINNLAQLRQHQSQNGYTWVLYTLPRHFARSMPEMYQILKKDFKIMKVFPGTLGDGDIIVSRSRKKGPYTINAH